MQSVPKRRWERWRKPEARGLFSHSQPTQKPLNLFRQALHIVGNDDLTGVGLSQGLQIFQTALQFRAAWLKFASSVDLAALQRSSEVNSWNTTVGRSRHSARLSVAAGLTE